MTSEKAQEVTLALPREIRGMTAEGTAVATGTNANERKLTLPAGRRVKLSITLK